MPHIPQRDRLDGLLPETVDRLMREGQQIDALAQVILEMLADDSLAITGNVAIGAVTTTLIHLVAATTATDGQHARKVAAVRGFVSILQAYCEAPTHGAGLVAMDAARLAANRATFERVDITTATTVAPRG